MNPALLFLFSFLFWIHCPQKNSADVSLIRQPILEKHKYPPWHFLWHVRSSTHEGEGKEFPREWANFFLPLKSICLSPSSVKVRLPLDSSVSVKPLYVYLPSASIWGFYGLPLISDRESRVSHSGSGASILWDVITLTVRVDLVYGCDFQFTSNNHFTVRRGGLHVFF